MKNGFTLGRFLRWVFIGDIPLWVTTVLLMMVAVVTIFSATSFFVNYKDDVTSEVLEHSFALMGGLIAALFIVRRGKGKYIVIALNVLYGCSLLMLAMILLQRWIPEVEIGGFKLFGFVTENGASRWMVIMEQNVQPSEFAKPTVLAMMIYLMTIPLEKCRVLRWIVDKSLEFRIKGSETGSEATDEVKKELEVRIRYFMAIASLAIVVLPIAKDNLSTGMITGGVGMIVMLMAGLKRRWTLLASLALLVAGTILVGIAIALPRETVKDLPGRLPTWTARIKSFAEPTDIRKYDEKNMQSEHSQMAVARGGVLGVGPGKSVERDYLPQIYADFVFAIIAEEYGIIGSVLVMFLYIVLLYRCGVIGRRATELDNNYGGLLVMSFGLIICIQAYVSMGVALNVGPVTGQPLPLISRGKWSVVITMLMLGVVQYFAWETKRAKQDKAISNNN